jgi:abortive infection bacteriophage resistance protein
MRTTAGYLYGGLAMKFTKPPLSIEKQINLLQSRGMAIDNSKRTARYLAHINYYRLRTYWLPFEDKENGTEHHFKPGTTFNDVLTLYLFDRKFRLLVMEAIERLEISFRTRFAHELAMRYGSHAHLDASLFRRTDLHRQHIKGLKKEIVHSKETFIKHYRTTYDDPELPPIWAICEVMTFGQLSIWFKNLKRRSDRNAIAGIYGIDEVILGSFMHHLTHIRNLTAHHCRLWNRRLVFTMTIPAFPVDLTGMFNSKANRNIYNTLVMLGYLMKLISPGTSWPARIKKLIEEYIPDKMAAMGFPDGWRGLPMWRDGI